MLSLAGLQQPLEKIARKPTIPLQDFTPDALPDTILPIYPGFGPAHSVPIARCKLCAQLVQSRNTQNT